VKLRICAVLILLASFAARADEPPPRPPPPVPMLPPPWVPYYAVPGPSPTQIETLEQAGRHNKRVGAILLGVGSAIAVTGTALAIAGWWDNGNACGCCDDHHHTCGDSALSIAGATTTLLGLGALIPGVILYVSGVSDVNRALRLKRAYWGPPAASFR
jgi:hypothetical protein